MPLTIRAIALALLASLAANLIATWLEGTEFEGMGFSDPLIFGTSFVWTLVVIWILWDLYRGRNIELSLLFVGLIIIVFAVWDFHDYGISLSLIFYLIEFTMFLGSWFLIRAPQSRRWLKAHKKHHD